jgi:ABC-type uncharacterized transport system ATPase subunit
MMNLYTSLVDISGLLHKPVRQMSLGQRTLSDILAAFLHNPSVPLWLVSKKSYIFDYHQQTQSQN